MTEQQTKAEPAGRVVPDYSWAKKLADDGTWVLHTGSRMVSKVVKFYDGVTEQYTSTYNNKPTQGPVLELEDGNTFVARSEADFVPMEPEEVKFYQFIQLQYGQLTQRLAAAGAQQKMSMAKTLLLIGTSLRTTARAADLAVAKPKDQKSDVKP